MNHQESHTTADKLITALESTHSVVLAAPPQSGKTSTYCLAAKKGMGILWDKVYLVCNMGDNALKKQTMNRFRDYNLRGSVLFNGEMNGSNKNVDQLSFLRTYGGRVLIIVDESHHGASVDGSLHKFLGRLGISASGEYDDELYNGRRSNLSRPYVITVSATPYAEMASIDQTKKKVVVHKPGRNYVGLGAYMDNGLIHDNSDGNMKNLELALKRQKRRSPRSYAIVRWGASGNRDHAAIGAIVSKLGYERIEYDQEYTRGRGICLDDIVRHRPSSFTIILVKSYCTAGQTFTKKNISLVWETRLDTDSQVQGLPGRCCGYLSSSERISARKMEIWCSVEAINDHCDFLKGTLRSLDDPEAVKTIVPSSGTNIKKSSSRSSRISSPEYMTWRLYDSLEEVRADIPRMRDYFMKTSKFRQQQGWYSSCPRFGLSHNRVHHTMEEARDDKGFIHQNMGKDVGVVKVWHIDEIRRIIANDPLYAAKKTGFKYDDKDWHSAKIAKVAYRDLDDPSSAVFMVYSYNGPVSTASTYGLARENSIYMSGVGPNTFSKSCHVETIITPKDEISIIDRYRDMILHANTPLVIVTSEEREYSGPLMYECADEAFDNLRWAGRVSPSLRFLQQYIDERMRCIDTLQFGNQPDAVRHVLTKMEATSESRAIFPIEAARSRYAKAINWRWITPINSVITTLGRKGTISRIEVSKGKHKYYL